MNPTRRTLAGALVGAAALFTATAFTFAQDAGKPGGNAAAGAANSASAAPSAAFMQDAMKRWMDANTPGAAHKQLARFLGAWDLETSMQGEGGPPMESKGTAEFHWLYDGRWLQQTWSAPMMGMPAAGQMTFGYDNFKKKYVTSAVDNFETTLLTSAGDFDQSGNTLITYGLMDEPMTGEVGKTVRYIWRLQGPDKIDFEVHDLAIGETNTKVYEVVYTRHK